jgi:hypothetical protein
VPGRAIDPDDLVTRTAAGDDVPPTFTTAADAIVWCEDWLIERYGGRHPAEDSYRFRGEVYLVADGPNPLAMHADGSVELYELTRNELIRSKIADREVHAAAPIVSDRNRIRVRLRTVIDERGLVAEGWPSITALVAPRGRWS